MLESGIAKAMMKKGVCRGSLICSVGRTGTASVAWQPAGWGGRHQNQPTSTVAVARSFQQTAASATVGHKYILALLPAFMENYATELEQGFRITF